MIYNDCVAYFIGSSITKKHKDGGNSEVNLRESWE